MTHELISILLLGLVGSVHCVGMCGGFALALAQVSGNKRDFLTRQVFYYFGKTLTYMMLGVIAGGFGAVIGALFSNVQQGLSILLGIVMIGVGLGLMGWLGGLKYSGKLALWRPLTSTMGRLMGRQGSLHDSGRQSAGASFALGLLNGLLPCGLVYGALAIAAVSGHALMGALYMGVFGLSTIPALFALASAGALMKPVWRSRLNQVSGIIVIVLGLVTIYRGLPGAHAGHNMGHEPEHQETMQHMESPPASTHPSHNH